MYFLVLICSLYFAFLLYLLVPSFKQKREHKARTLDGLSIVIPFRNEAFFLPRLVDSIDRLNRGDLSVEFIFVNDHSTDLSEQCVKGVASSFVITSSGSGKKAAILEGLLRAKNDWILTIDADVTLPETFLKEMSVLPLDNLKMLVLPIQPTQRRGVVPAFFDLEFIALQGVGLGMADKGMPLLSNGACLLFERKAFLDVNDSREDYQIKSGDDIFSMFAIADQYGDRSVGAGLSLTPVQSAFPNGLVKLFEQRTRWISKTTYVKNLRYKIIAFGMAVMHLLPLALACALFAGILSIPVVLGLLAIKWSGEWIFFWYLTRSFKRVELIFYVPIAQLLYPFYIFALIVSALVERRRQTKPTWDAA
jgi:cellulose synthase/poly-beta-1,6-N-acetylglucosamine synthase-like glycosyltransferase